MKIILFIPPRISHLSHVAASDTQNQPTEPTNMTPQTIAKLHKFFSTLDADLTHDLAFALADKIGTSYEAIVAQYEAWQIA
jgi:plasmid maintenance system antidote protein VapI